MSTYLESLLARNVKFTPLSPEDVYHGSNIADKACQNLQTGHHNGLEIDKMCRSTLLLLLLNKQGLALEDVQLHMLTIVNYGLENDFSLTDDSINKLLKIIKRA